MSNHNILLMYTITPKNHSAFQRMNALIQYLSEKGHNMHVLCAPDDDYSHYQYKDNVSFHFLKDKGLFKRLDFKKSDGKIFHKIKAICNVAISYLIPNPNYNWTKRAYNQAKEIIKKNNIDTIISSYAPNAPHLVSLKLKDDFPKLKWIADMRDEMSTSPYLKRLARYYTKRCEQKSVNNADAVVSVSEPILEDFKRFCKTPSVIFKEIRNGYNFDADKTSPLTNNELFTITYLGSFYGDINPNNFLKALSNLMAKQKLDIKVNFIGRSIPIKIPDNLKDIVHTQGAVPYDEVKVHMKQADALFMIYPTINRHGVYSGKLFEYLASGKPIIGMLDPTDVASKLIKQTNAGYTSCNSDIDGIEATILQAYTAWENKEVLTRNWDLVEDHHRSKQADKFEALIQELHQV